MKIIAAVYSHPEYYPPTLNAVDTLSSKVEEVIVVCRNVKETKIQYPNNVKLIKTGEFKSIGDTQISSYFWKLKSFIIYTTTLYKLIKKNNPDWVIAYDPIPLLAYSLIVKIAGKKTKIWYHNHDIYEKSKLKRYSISWFAAKNEATFFSYIDLFSLPSIEREMFFPMDKLKGKYFFLPNFPSLKNYRGIKREKIPENLKLIYQGHIGDGHGLEEIIRFIDESKSTTISLSIIGPGDSYFIEELDKMIIKFNLSEQVKIIAPLPYNQLRDFTAQHDVGWAVLLPKNVNFKTASTSSNKIYEYIANGLPVILYDIENYTNILAVRKWAFFSNLSKNSLDKIFSTIANEYQSISDLARHDFEKELNFDIFFEPILQYLSTECTT